MTHTVGTALSQWSDGCQQGGHSTDLGNVVAWAELCPQIHTLRSWPPTPQDRAFTEVLVLVSSYGWVLIHHDWCPEKTGNVDAGMQGEGRVDMGTAVCPLAKERNRCSLAALRKSQPCQRLDLGLLASRRWDSKQW